MSFKDIYTESNGLAILEDNRAPVQRIDKDDMVAAVNRMRAIVPNGDKMSIQSLTVIAHEAILYRIVPGRDMHYYEGKNGLVRIPDYKYLKNFAGFKEQLVSGDDTATIEDNYRPLSEADKSRHSIPDHCIAAECRITTKRERQAFAAEVKQWRELDFSPKEALALAKETYGEIGTTAIGVWDPQELDRWGKPVTPPKGWSPLQVAEKLAFKNAMNRKYGIPTADEMSAMAHRMAHRAMPEHWRDEHADKPIDVQARLADLEAIASEVRGESEGMTIEQHAERQVDNVELMRGPSMDEGIGEDWQEGESLEDTFYQLVLTKVPYYNHTNHVKATMKKLGLIWRNQDETDLLDELNLYAKKRAYEKEAQQDRLFSDEPQSAGGYEVE